MKSITENTLIPLWIVWAAAAGVFGTGAYVTKVQSQAEAAILETKELRVELSEIQESRRKGLERLNSVLSEMNGRLSKIEGFLEKRSRNNR